MASYAPRAPPGAARNYTRRRQQPQQIQPPKYSHYEDYDRYDQYQHGSTQQQQQQQQHLQVRDTAPPQVAGNSSNRGAKRLSQRPASSIYSQPSPVTPGFQFQPARPSHQHNYSAESQYSQPDEPAYDQRQAYGHTYMDPRSQYLQYSQAQSQSQKPRNADGVSPESSPELTPATHPGSIYRAPSPLDMSAAVEPTTDGPAAVASRSSIGSMRRERRQNQDAAARTLREAKSRERLERLQQSQERSNSMTSTKSKRGYQGGEVRWDPRTGELTSSQKGRPSQVKPIEFVRGLATDIPSPPEGSPSDIKTEVASFASRLRKTSGPHTAAPSANGAVPPLPTLRSVSAANASALPVAVASLSSPSSPSSSPAPSAKTYDATDPAAAAFSSSRPPWHGASGRTAIVAPVHDTPNVAPLNIPRRSSKRVASNPQLKGSQAGHSGPDAQVTGLASPPVSPSSSNTHETLDQKATFRRAVSALGQHTAHISSTPKARNGQHLHAQNPTPPPSVDAQSQGAIRRKPTPSHVHLASFDANDPFNYNNRTNLSTAIAPPELRPPAAYHDDAPADADADEWSSTINEADEHEPYSTPKMPTLPESMRQKLPFHIKRRPTNQPAPPSSEGGHSDDSASTAQRPATTATVGTVGTVGTASSFEPDSVMERRRPPRLGPRSIKNGVEPVVISLNTPWMSGAHTPVREKTPGPSGSGSGSGNSSGDYFGAADDRASIAGSIHKTLPLAPPEMSAKDRVAMLNAQLAGLAQRRINIGRSIKQMTELMPTDNLLAAPDVLQKREMEKRKVEGLRSDLAEIQREEYEIGLKLHRAYKRLDKNAEYEPTTLWVRRVTG